MVKEEYLRLHFWVKSIPQEPESSDVEQTASLEKMSHFDLKNRVNSGAKI